MTWKGGLVTAAIGGVTGTFTYDAFGNRKTVTGETNCNGQTLRHTARGELEHEPSPDHDE